MKVNKTICDIKDCDAERDGSAAQMEDWISVSISSACNNRNARTIDMCPKHAKGLLEFIVVKDLEPAESPV